MFYVKGNALNALKETSPFVLIIWDLVQLKEIVPSHYIVLFS
jgi:hypothetical protein